MGVFSRAKDKLVEQAALSYLNGSLLAPYGKATSLAVDSGARTVSLTLELKGEASPVELELTDYQITEEAGRYFAVVRGARTSREWLTSLAQDQLCNHRFEIPAQAGRWLIKLM